MVISFILEAYMADVLSHGGDTRGDLSHQGSSHIPAQCQSYKYYNYYLLFYFKILICFFLTEILKFYFINVAQPKRRWASRGVKLQQLFKANGCRSLRLKFDWDEGTISPVGDHHELVSRFVSTHIKYNMAPYYKDWDEVEIHFKSIC